MYSAFMRHFDSCDDADIQGANTASVRNGQKYKFGLGAAGAAIAIVIGNICSDLYFIWFLSKLLSIAMSMGKCRTQQARAAHAGRLLQTRQAAKKYESLLNGTEYTFFEHTPIVDEAVSHIWWKIS